MFQNSWHKLTTNRMEQSENACVNATSMISHKRELVPVRKNYVLTKLQLHGAKSSNLPNADEKSSKFKFRIS